MSDFPVYYVEWIDACSLAACGWKGEEELEEFFDEQWLIRDVGFLIKETKDYICMVGGHNVKLGDFDFCGHRDLKIPVKCIVRKIRLKLPKRRK